jgi:DNA primase
LVGLDIQEINNILKNNIQTNIKRTNRKIAKRIPINPIRRFILFIIIKPELVIESDLKIFTSNENDLNLAKKIIQNALANKENNAAVMLHFLESEIDQEQFKEIEEQIAKIDDDLSINDEVEALRESLQKKLLTSLNKTKLSEIQQKSLSSLTDEEKTFLKNFRRK